MPTNTRSKAANAPKRRPKAPHLREVPKTDADQEPTKPWLSRLDDVPAIASYLRRVEATPMSLRRAVIEERTSKYHVEKYVFTFAKDGAVTVTRPNGTEIECAAPDAPPDPDQWLLPSDAEVPAIQNGVAAFRWPDAQCGIGLPGELEAKDKREGRDYFVCKTREGKTLMVHERLKTEDERGKRYRPWSYWSDRQWRPCEPGEIRHEGRVLLPDGKLPLYGLDKMGYKATVFVHEGAKAAATIQRAADCYNKALEGLGSAMDAESREECHWALTHPYMPALAHGAHIGWISGAQQPHRVHWEPLKEALKGEASAMVYLIADNDHDGVWALPQLSRGLGGLRVLRVVFTPQFPAGFDLADNLPDWMWKKVYAKNPDGTEGEVLKDKAGREVRRFIGPPLSKLLHPATWASAIVPTGKKGRPLTVVTRAFCEMWIYVRSTQEYVCKELPSLRFLAPQLNSECSGYSDTHEVSKLLDKGARLSVPTLLYDPSREGMSRLTEDGFNIYEPSLVQVEDGSVQPFLDFMSYLFVNPEERRTVMRWVATLIARPDIKMHYGLLLVSEHQGTGKNTLGEHILAPLVGLHNTGFVSERQIVDSVFNGWAVNKRLVFCPEIYEGHSFKAYNKLKTYITDKTIEVNEKFQRPYTVACWCHIIACSNDRKALRIEESDRRMFYPELTETPWPRPQWQAFYHWLEREGGLGIILRWALEFHEDESNGDYIYEGEQPPMTANKADLIERSKSPSRQEAEDIGAALAAERAPACITYSDLRSHIVETLKPKFAEDKKTLADWAVGKGAIRATTTLQKEGLREAGNVKIGGRMEYVLANEALMAALRSAGSEAAQNDLIRQHRIAVTGVAGALLVTDEPHAALFDETM